MKTKTWRIKKKSNKKYEYEYQNAHIKERKKMESNTRMERKKTHQIERRQQQQKTVEKVTKHKNVR